MVSVNRVIVAGNLTRDPETRQVGESVVCNFGIAINEAYTTSSGDKKEDVCFIEVESWNRQAETCKEYLKKGSSVLIEGNLKFDQWEDGNGNRRSKHKIRIQRIQFLGGKWKQDSQQQDSSQQKEETSTEPVPPDTGDDIPF